MAFFFNFIQDFHKLKVLPKDLDKFNSVETVLDEFDIKREEDNEILDPDDETILIQKIRTTATSPALATSVDPSVVSPKQTRSPLDAIDTTNLIRWLNVTKLPIPNSSLSQDYEIIIREGKETITIYPETITKLLNSFSTDQSSTKASARVISPLTTDPPVWKEELMKKYPNVFESTETVNDTAVDKEEELDFLKKISDTFERDDSTTDPPLWEDLDTNLIPDELHVQEQEKPSDNIVEEENYEDYYDNSGETGQSGRGGGVLYSRYYKHCKIVSHNRMKDRHER